MRNPARWTPAAVAVAAALVFVPAAGQAQATPPTDEALRAGMANIRKLVEPQLPAVHAGKLSAAQYGELAQRIEGEVGTIVANCKLEPKADAMLHLVIADVGGGVDAMAGKSKTVRPAQGAAQVVAALNQYARYFNDPGFKPIRAGH